MKVRLLIVTFLCISVTSYSQLSQDIKPLREQRDSVYRVINEYREGLGMSKLKRSKHLQFWSDLYTWQIETFKTKRHSKALRKGTAEIICFSGVDCLESWSNSISHNQILTATKADKIGIGISHGTIVARIRMR